MRVVDILAKSAELLKRAGVEEYQLDSRLLLEFVLKMSRTELFLAAERQLTEDEFDLYQSLLSRREKREPVAYIIGEQDFWSLTFNVTPDVLIPRPETEFLLEQVFAKTSDKNFNNGNILDLCCGSGVIASILALEKGKVVYGVDISEKALLVCQSNLLRNNLTKMVQLIQSDLLAAFTPKAWCSLVVSNPPYVSHIDVKDSLEPEVGQYEPQLALDGGVRGMEVIAVMREQLEYSMLPGGQLFMEFGADQAQEITELFGHTTGAGSGFSFVEVLQDYAGRDRVLHAVKN
jgi:release factor glutamine methyltransferase